MLPFACDFRSIGLLDQLEICLRNKNNNNKYNCCETKRFSSILRNKKKQFLIFEFKSTKVLKNQLHGNI